MTWNIATKKEHVLPFSCEGSPLFWVFSVTLSAVPVSIVMWGSVRDAGASDAPWEGRWDALCMMDSVVSAVLLIVKLNRFPLCWMTPNRFEGARRRFYWSWIKSKPRRTPQKMFTSITPQGFRQHPERLDQIRFSNVALHKNISQRRDVCDSQGVSRNHHCACFVFN